MTRPSTKVCTYEGCDANTRILLFILAFHEQHGRGPLVGHVCESIGLESKGNVHRHLKQLQRAGLIDWDQGKRGTLRPACRRVA